MTRKHYKAIAEILADVKSDCDWYGPHEYPGIAAHEEIVEALATYFAKENPRFDRVKFEEACGL